MIFDESSTHLFTAYFNEQISTTTSSTTTSVCACTATGGSNDNCECNSAGSACSPKTTCYTGTSWGSCSDPTDCAKCCSSSYSKRKNRELYKCGSFSCALNDGTSSPVCGNGVKETGETCDGSDFSETCVSLNQPSGTLVCLSDCSGFDTIGCTGITAPSCDDIGGLGDPCTGNCNSCGENGSINCGGGNKYCLP